MRRMVWSSFSKPSPTLNHKPFMPGSSFVESKKRWMHFPMMDDSLFYEIGFLKETAILSKL
jgi:hypothetical protein